MDKDKAKQACILAFCNKVCAGSSVMPKLKIIYDGQFPYQKVVDAAQAPEKSKNKKENDMMHKKAWNKMYNLFNDVWNDKGSW